MNSSIKLVLIGGLVSLLSTLAGMILQHWLEKQKITIQARQHLTQIVYAKQTEFFDKLSPILAEINGYITTIGVWLAEKDKEAKEKVKQAANKNGRVAEFHDLLEQYYMYLPKELLEEANELFVECMFLGNSPSENRAHDCMEKLLGFQNLIREVIGIDRLSTDLMKVLASNGKNNEEA